MPQLCTTAYPGILNTTVDHYIDVANIDRLDALHVKSIRLLGELRRGLDSRMKVHLKALGCRLNEAELEQWADDFQSQGFGITAEPEDADILVLNTCAVTQGASRKSRNLINRLHRGNPCAHLVITGCHSSLNHAEVAKTLGVDLVIGNDKKNDLPNIIKNRLDLSVMPVSATQPGDIALYLRGRHRAFIKIQDGCRHRCTYCIVTLARGEEQSRETCTIIDDINRLTEAGISEAVLTGVHVGGYGSDTNSSLNNLIESILRETDLKRLRLASVEPWDLSDDFMELFLNKRLMPHIHLPLQSGSDNVLRRMSRRCRQNDFLALTKKARSVVSNFNITTDIIAGFPGETEAEWQQTMDFVSQISFGHVHIFPFSSREGTKAASLPDQIDIDIKKERCRKMAQLAEKMKMETLNRAIGKTARILWERKKASDDELTSVYSGYTENYLRAEIAVPVSDNPNINLDALITECTIDGINSSSQHLTVKCKTL